MHHVYQELIERSGRRGLRAGRRFLHSEPLLAEILDELHALGPGHPDAQAQHDPGEDVDADANSHAERGLSHLNAYGARQGPAPIPERHVDDQEEHPDREPQVALRLHRFISRCQCFYPSFVLISSSSTLLRIATFIPSSISKTCMPEIIVGSSCLLLEQSRNPAKISGQVTSVPE